MPDAPVTHAEWERHRKTSRQTLPDTLKGQSLPDVLLPYQQRAVAAIMELPVVVIEKSRRIGLTWGIAAASVLLSASSRSAGGMDTLYLGYSLDMAREFIDTAAMWAKAGESAMIMPFIIWVSASRRTDSLCFRRIRIMRWM